MSNLAGRIRDILRLRFVKSEEMAELLALAIGGGKNCIIFGPGGHAKSEMVGTVIAELGLKDRTFVQSFGEGMDETRLWGGLDFRRLEEDKVLEFFPERSFLAAEYAIFEELFDAPPMVLLALKDALTAREMRNGAQRFPMVTKTIIALTNREPAEISELGPSAHALIERFPLRFELRWESYTQDDYQELLEVVSGTPKGCLSDVWMTLASMLGEASATGDIVSPRTAVHAYHVVREAAKLRGGKKVELVDLHSLRFLIGMEVIAPQIQERLHRAEQSAKAKRDLDELANWVASINVQVGQCSSPIKLLQMVQDVRSARELASAVKVPDDLVRQKEMISALTVDVENKALQKAVSSTRPGESHGISDDAEKIDW